VNGELKNVFTLIGICQDVGLSWSLLELFWWDLRGRHGNYGICCVSYYNRNTVCNFAFTVVQLSVEPPLSSTTPKGRLQDLPRMPLLSENRISIFTVREAPDQVRFVALLTDKRIPHL
jgi:hypothetical protein